MKRCPACGGVINEGETICPDCGMDISTLETSSEQSSHQQTQPQENESFKTQQYQQTLEQPQQDITVQAKLILKQWGVLTSVEYPIGGKKVIIGRFDPEKGPPDIDLSNIEGGQYVSRRHAEIYRDEDGKWYIKDLGSTNGTFLIKQGSPERIPPNSPRELTDGAEIAFGAVKFIFKID
jgi:pSer/pThr/pTyr-binding forkhead associated (FHA) protein